MMLLTNLILFALSLPAAAVGMYLLLLTVLSAKPPPPGRSSGQLRFDVIVPAHDEAAVIERVVASLRGLRWPTDGFRVIVVADNCTDATASLARAAGAQVLERRDSTRRGKGYALELGFQVSRERGWATAVVVIDADSVVSPDLLEAFAARIERAATAVQAHYRVLNAGASWRTRLMSIALASFHQVRSRGRERLQLSCGLRGNGWCVTHRVLREVPYQAFSLAEDIEYGIALGMAGHRVQYADEAGVAAAMVSDGCAAGTQRQRWEGGRFRLIRDKTPALLRAAIGPGGRVCLDLALDLLVLPLSYVALNVVVVILLAGLASLRTPAMAPWLWLGVASASCLALYVLRGWQLSGVGIRGLLDLARIPHFIVWKALLMLRTRTSPEWIRTKREQT
jgi:cellulose synthase/poly-beta-1,6-N-acetylglucosamine synthase-like glycosyltransferase